MWTNNTVFDFSQFDNGVGASGFGLAHGAGVDLRPTLPTTTPELIGIDLTHRIDVADIANAAGGGSGKPGGGGGGGGGGASFAPYTSGPVNAAAGYNVTIEFKGSWTQSLHDIFTRSADFFSTLITGDVQNVTVMGLKGGPRVVDDILITAELAAIDGAGGVLGQAGPTSIRSSGFLPATATMKFDSVDVAAMGPLTFEDVVVHEMAHSLGFGSIWGYLGLVAGGLFVGAGAVAEYVAMGGDAAGVPVETDGGGGTAGAHWDEETFDNELMTGYIDASNYFTSMSAASFGDLGYLIAGNYAQIAGVDSGYVLPV